MMKLLASKSSTSEVVHKVCFRSVKFAIVIVLTIFSVLATGGNCFSQQSPQTISRIEEVITKWDKDQHLYVKGDLGVTPERFEFLETWLDENAKNWTIVLLRESKDEFYLATDGRKFFGMDAVEFALSNGLSNRTEFSELIDEKTGEANGAVFALFLKERKFSYMGSDIHDRRRLGQAKWIGDLDREAIRAMRNGSRVVDAVKNTVLTIDRRLKQRIKAERAAAVRDAEAKKKAVELAKRERQRTIDNFKSLVEETTASMLPQAERAAKSIREKFEEASESKLANPPTGKWRTNLKGLVATADSRELQDETDLRRSPMFRDLKTETVRLRSEIDNYLDLFAAHSAFDEMIGSVEQRLDLVADHPSGAAVETSTEAYRLLDEARLGHRRGELDFSDLVQQADELAGQSETAIRLEQQRVQAEKERKSLIRRTLSIVGSVLGACFLGLLWILNIRRRPALKRAHELFDKKSKVVSEQVGQVNELVQRTEGVLGTRATFLESKYSGQTEKLGLNALHKVENLKSMADEANRVMEYAGELIHPSGPIAEAANMFTGARYEHCVNELNGKSLNIAAPVKEDGSKGDPIWLSLDEVASELNNQSAGVTENLDQFETGTKQVGKHLAALQSRIEEAESIEDELSRASRRDRLFQVPALFEKLLPSVQQACDTAESLASHDPVLAVSDKIPSAVSKIEEGLAIAKSIQTARGTTLPSISKSEDGLKKLGFDTRWIEDRVEDLSERADELVEQASVESIGDDVSVFSESMLGIGLRVTRTLTLANQLKEEAVPRLEKLEKGISKSRAEIASKLGIDASKALSEQEYNPDVELKQARKQFEAATASLNFGGVESARESLDALDIEASEAEHFIESSLESLRDFADNHKNRKASYELLLTKAKQQGELIASAKSRFVSSALDLQDHFEEGGFQPSSKPTVGNLLHSGDALLANVSLTLETSDGIHHDGAVLQAANSLVLVQDDLDSVESMFREIESHCLQLDQYATENNRQLTARAERLAEMETDVNEQRTQAESKKLFELAGNHFQTFKQDCEQNTQRDPFVDANWLARFEGQLDELQAAIRSDRQAFEEAKDAIGGARNELRNAQRLVAKSLSDQIPDSATIRSCQDEVTSLEIELDKINDLLGVPHNNWEVVDGQALNVHGRLGIAVGKLRNELERARQAANLLQDAGAEVYKAANWSGAYNMIVVGRPGSEELDQARRLLEQGNYQRSMEFSKAAKMYAHNAVEEAERQVKKKRRAIARKAEAERRRKQAAASFYIGPNSGGSGNSSVSTFASNSSRRSRSSSRSRSNNSGSSSSNSSSSRSRSRRSSGGNGSGFSRSGW